MIRHPKPRPQRSLRNQDHKRLYASMDVSIVLEPTHLHERLHGQAGKTIGLPKPLARKARRGTLSRYNRVAECNAPKKRAALAASATSIAGSRSGAECLRMPVDWISGAGNLPARDRSSAKGRFA